jgi:predicted phage terminase large subunit-like protein
MASRLITSQADQLAWSRLVRDPERGLEMFTRAAFFERKGFRFVVNHHHRAIWAALTRVYRGECRRLIINIPPRYGKTEIAVISFMAWATGMSSDAEWIHTSYSAELAAANSVEVRNLVTSDFFRAVFPDVLIRADANRQDHWRTTAGGVVYAQGAGGAITGFGAGKMRPGFGGAIVIDDPHKAGEAHSKKVREGVLSWFQNTLESRKNDPERTPIILIMQRLHSEDLAGWLLGDRGADLSGPAVPGANGETWEHLCLSAIQPDGSALWPAKHSIEKLREMERASPYVFAGQYQQRPSPIEGGIFDATQVQIVDAVPAVPVKWFRGWDLGSTIDGDYTAGVRLGKLADGRYIIGDVRRLREGPDKRDAALKNAADADGPGSRQSLPQDPGQAGKSQALYFARLLAGHRVHTSPESGDKVARAEMIAAQVNVGNVLMLRGPWNKEMLDEMQLFPNGTHDDQVDGLSRAFSALLHAPQGASVATHSVHT